LIVVGAESRFYRYHFRKQILNSLYLNRTLHQVPSIVDVFEGGVGQLLAYCFNILRPELRSFLVGQTQLEPVWANPSGAPFVWFEIQLYRTLDLRGEVSDDVRVEGLIG